MKSSNIFPSQNRKLNRRVLLGMYRSLFRHYGDRNWWPGETPFEVMIGAILTQNTSWRNVEKAITNLKSEKVLSPRALKEISLSRLARLIRPAGYFNVKSIRLKNFIKFLWEEFNGKPELMFRAPLQKLRIKLLNVNGIGEETADSILLYAAQKRIFVVDAYTRRVLLRHGYLKGKETYSEIQKIFTELLPKNLNLYNDYHAQIVGVGKDFCRGRAHCQGCPLQPYL